MNLKSVRAKIDVIDSAILSFLNKRAKLSLQVGRIKHKNNQQIYSPDREREVMGRIKSLNKGPIKNESLEAIYTEVMSSSLSLEKKLLIAYLGPKATFTNQAALKKFGSSVNYLAVNSITDVFTEVEKINADYGVVPIENSIEGAVTHTLDMLVDSDLKICSQILLEISHNLLSRYKKANIKKIYSIAQVFGQCRIWLETNMPNIELIEVSSTTKAAQICAREKNSACIASLLAAKEYKLDLIARSIEDSPHNIKRFLVIGKDDCPQTGKDRTSLIFSIKDSVGALHDMLVPFKKYKINLTKIESRPSKRRAWNYFFFVDLEGHRLNPNVKKALNQLEEKCKFLKVLGSYPVGE